MNHCTTSPEPVEEIQGLWLAGRREPVDLTMKELSSDCDNPAYRRCVAFIRDAGLPTEDLPGAGTRLFGFWSGRILTGTAALEPYCDGVLLRSVAVREGERGKGLGSEIVTKTLAVAESDYKKDIYILTEKAEGFFARYGFRTVSRDQVPPGVSASGEFAGLCPLTASAMVRVSARSG